MGAPQSEMSVKKMQFQPMKVQRRNSSSSCGSEDEPLVDNMLSLATCLPDDELSPLSNSDSPCGGFVPPGGMLLRNLSDEPIVEEETDETECEDEAAPRPPPPPSAPPPAPTAQMSVGSALHGTGSCRPCAWFYKPQGCANASECRHCHLCPEGEVKLRKKARAVAEAMAKRASEKQLEEEVVESTMDTLPSLPSVCMDAMPVSILSVESIITASESSSEDVEPCGALPPPPGLALPSPGPSAAAKSISLGSSLHGTGQCKPCAWFHKRQGCQNGASCRHCHLCPEGEIRSRRRVKVAAMRAELSDEEEEEEEGQPMMPTASVASLGAMSQASEKGVQQPAEQVLLLALQEAQQQVLQQVALAAHFQAQALFAAQLATAQAAQAPARPLELSRAVASGPSIGSAAHELGQCKPCAWFWKPRGCVNGQACSHCHLCPPGALKERKRLQRESAKSQVEAPKAELGAPAAVPELATSKLSPRKVSVPSIGGAEW